MYNGTIVTSTGTRCSGRIRLVQNSINVSNNTSNVTLFYEINLVGTYVAPLREAYGLHAVNRAIDYSGDYDFTESDATMPSGSGYWQVVKQVTFTATHNDAGVATINAEMNIIGWDQTANGFSVFCSGSATIENTYKATTPTIAFGTQASALNMGSAGTITLPRNSTQLTHRLRFSWGSLAQQTLTTSAGASYSWTPAIATYAPYVVSRDTGSGTLYCDTYNGSTLVGTTSITAWLKVPGSVKPTATITTSDTTGYLAEYGGYVQGKSVLQSVVTGTGIYGSTISSLSSVFDSTTKSGATTTFTPSVSGTRTVTGNVIDSRGHTGTASTTIEVLPYSAPTITSATVDRCDQDGTPNQQGAYAKVTETSNFSPLNGGNTKVVSARYKTQRSSTWSSWVTGDPVIFAASPDYSYDVEIRVSDDFSSATVARQLLGTVVLVDYGGSETVRGTGLAFGGLADKADTFQNYLAAEFYNGLDVDQGITADTLDVTGNATVGGTLGVTGGATAQSLTTTGNVTSNSGIFLAKAEPGVQTNNPNVTRGTAPSSDTWGVTHHSLRDKNGTQLAYIRTPFMADGREGLQLEQTRSVNGSNVYHGVQLFIDSSGNRTVVVSYPRAWMKAIGTWTSIATSTGTTSKSFTNLSTQGYTEVMVVCKHSSGKLATATVPIAALTTSTQELWLGGGKSAANTAAGGATRAVCNLSLTSFAGISTTNATTDTTSSSSWTVYVR